jgi:hypothetical protein
MCWASIGVSSDSFSRKTAFWFKFFNRVVTNDCFFSKPVIKFQFFFIFTQILFFEIRSQSTIDYDSHLFSLKTNLTTFMKKYNETLTCNNCLIVWPISTKSLCRSFQRQTKELNKQAVDRLSQVHRRITKR